MKINLVELKSAIKNEVPNCPIRRDYTEVAEIEFVTEQFVDEVLTQIYLVTMLFNPEDNECFNAHVFNVFIKDDKKKYYSYLDREIQF